MSRLSALSARLTAAAVPQVPAGSLSREMFAATSRPDPLWPRTGFMSTILSPPAVRPLFAQAVAASLQGRVAIGPRAGQPGSRASVSMRMSRCPRRRRDQLERLVRYLVRPPLALDRLTESTDGHLLTLSRPRHGPAVRAHGTGHPACGRG